MGISQGKSFRILMCIPGVTPDASVAIFQNVFERISVCQLDIIKPQSQNWDWGILDNYALVITVREIRGLYGQIVKVAKARGIVTAYATDDNLHELAKIYPLYQDFNFPGPLETLRGIDYVLCTNPNLCRYYQRLTDGQIVWIPVNVPKEDVPDCVNPMDSKVIAGYFGNPRPVFSEIALALIDIKTTCPNLVFHSAGVDLNSLGVVSEYHQFDLDFKRALQEMKGLRPHILIAPNSAMATDTLQNTNLSFKNIVKLLDATRIGAVLIASRIGPFESLNEEHGVLTIDNTFEAWRNTMMKLIREASLRSELFKRARRFILEHHETSIIAERICREMEKVFT